MGGGRYFGHDTPYVYGWKQNVITLWDVRSGRKLHEYFGHTGRVISLAFSPDGQTLASGGTEGTVILWNVEP
jgi:WD40 repeat protein